MCPDLRNYMTGVGSWDNKTTHQWMIVDGSLVRTNFDNLTDLMLTVDTPRDNQSFSLLTNVKVTSEAKENMTMWNIGEGVCEDE